MLSLADLLRAISLGNDDETAEDRHAGLLDYHRRNGDKRPTAGETTEICLPPFESAERTITFEIEPPPVTPSRARLQAGIAAITACTVFDAVDQESGSASVPIGAPLDSSQFGPWKPGVPPFMPGLCNAPLVVQSVAPSQPPMRKVLVKTMS